MNTNPEKLYFEGILENIFKFEELIENKGANINKDSELEKVYFSILEAKQVFEKASNYDNKIDNRETFRRMCGLGDILGKIISQKDSPDFNKLWPHIYLLLGDAIIAQNVWAPPEDQISNKIFELYVASMVMKIGVNLEMDDPVRSAGGENPDVIITIDGQKWGFACKVLHSDNPKTFVDNLKTGINQIENSDVEKGVVIFNLKVLVKQDDLWPISRNPGSQEIYYQSFPNTGPIEAKLQKYCYDNSQIRSVFDNNIDAIKEIFKQKKTIPAAILYIPTVSGIVKDGRPLITLVRQLCLQRFLEIDAADNKVIDKINLALHNRINLQ